MNKEELLEMLEGKAELGKAELAATLIGIFSAALAIAKDTKDRKERLILAAILVLVLIQGGMLGALIWLK